MTVVIIIGVVILLVLIAVSLTRQSQQRAADKAAKAAAYTGEVEAQQEESRVFRQRQRDSYAAAHAEPAQTTASDADE